MQYGTVTWRALASNGDPLEEKVRFIPEASAVLANGTDPATTLPAFADGMLDSEGYLCDPDDLTDGVLNEGATRGVQLLIPEDGVTNPPAWTYRVEPMLRYQGQYVPYAPWSITVTGDADLTSLAPVVSAPTDPASPGGGGGLSVVVVSPGVFDITGGGIVTIAPGVFEIGV